jgi:hypothetical protein
MGRVARYDILGCSFLMGLDGPWYREHPLVDGYGRLIIGNVDMDTVTEAWNRERRHPASDRKNGTGTFNPINVAYGNVRLALDIDNIAADTGNENCEHSCISSFMILGCLGW